MNYVEVRQDKSGFRVTVPGASDKPWVGGEAFVGAIIAQLGVRAIGPWEVAHDPDGTPYQRAVIL